jgi:flagellar protein FliT
MMSQVMITLLNDYLQKSAQLFKHLTVIPEGKERTEYIEKINHLLDEREELVFQLQQSNFQFDDSNKTHKTLYELDKGIRERLSLVMNAVKNDIKDLQNTKRNELHYIDPYENLRIIEGRYYDGKK